MSVYLLCSRNTTPLFRDEKSRIMLAVCHDFKNADYTQAYPGIIFTSLILLYGGGAMAHKKDVLCAVSIYYCRVRIKHPWVGKFEP